MIKCSVHKINFKKAVVDILILDKVDIRAKELLGRNETLCNN
jgi:hypothetical protein